MRVAVPSCAVNNIRGTFPADLRSSYTGLKRPNQVFLKKAVLQTLYKRRQGITDRLFNNIVNSENHGLAGYMAF